MQQGNRPRNLRDISHLYLSKHDAGDEGATGSAALVLVASLGAGPLRAWLSAGLAEAFAAQNVTVTLVDAGRSLPNAGYYFTLGPDRYLRPVIDEGASVETDTGSGVRMICSRARDLSGYMPASTASGPRVILVAFEWPGIDASDRQRALFDSFPEGLPAFLLTLSDSSPRSAEGILRAFGELFPGVPALALFPEREGGQPRDERQAGGIEPCPFPAEMLETLSRRKPPVSAFLTGLAGEILQRLGSRKKGAVRGRVG